jgi:hypothetical protein
MRAQKMRGEVAKKERDEYFNTIRPVIPKKQEWRVKEKVHAPAPTTSDNDMDLLDDDEALLIKDGSPPLADMDINMLFTLLAKFRGVEEKVAQMCLDPKEAMFKMREESSQHLMPLYIRGHINKKLISRMLVDGSAPMKTNLMLNGVGANPMEARGVVSMELTIGSKSLTTTFFVVEVQGNYSVILSRNWIHANHCIPSTLHQFLI